MRHRVRFGHDVPMSKLPAVPEDFLKWRTRPRGPRVAAIGGGVPAQTVYADFIKDIVSPRLRAAGLVGSGGRYSLKSETHWALIGFQKSWYSDKNEVRFTVNLLVVRRDEWTDLHERMPHLGATPSALISYGPPVRSARIGKLVDDHEDKWWRVNSSQNMDLLAAEVLDNIVAAGLPWLHEQIATT